MSRLGFGVPQMLSLSGHDRKKQYELLMEQQRRERRDKLNLFKDWNGPTSHWENGKLVLYCSDPSVFRQHPLVAPFYESAAQGCKKPNQKIVVDYGSALPTHYEVTVEGPKGGEVEYDTHSRAAANAFGSAAEEAFGRGQPQTRDEENDLLMALLEVFNRAML